MAGIDEAKEELGEVVDFLREPERYRKLGARIPRGVLLSGPPGTGKTLLARAVAGEADVPFFWLSASEFVEMLVGVGASRVRDLFAQAKAAAPAIIFIDELDAIGRSRAAGGALGGNDEREQTLNQILTEMDGFTGNEGVIVHGGHEPSRGPRPGAAACRAASTAASSVNPPDQKGRAAILRVHTRDVPAGSRRRPRPHRRRDGRAWSAPTSPTWSTRPLCWRPSDGHDRRPRGRLLRSPRNDRPRLGATHRPLSARERERTAYHESGHALLGMLQPGADPVRKVSIVPRGQALGVTFQSPQADRYGYAASYLRGRIIGRTRGAGGRGARLRRHDHRRRVGPRAGQRHRPPDGGALGHVGGDRAGLRDAARRGHGLAWHAKAPRVPRMRHAS